VLELLIERGVQVAYTDPYVPTLRTERHELVSVARPKPSEHDLVVLHTVHPRMKLGWLDGCERVLDCTYRRLGGRRRFLLG
jgi:UDP-N-acetyl-D-mannosaminuronate dehydrogenase